MKQAVSVALGMSGGVDSAVSAVLLQRMGYRVIGVTCRFCDDETSACAEDDAAATCKLLGIPHVVHEFVAEFERHVITPFVHSYKQGLTPSPCVSCNAHCKIPALLQVAEKLGCAHIATGHYARIARLSESGRFAVKTAFDMSKDQSYMLALLSQEHLSQLLLPLGNITKDKVRCIASDLELPVAKKPESQDNCFIRDDYRSFLRRHDVVNISGDIADAKGNVIGRHKGLSNYTIGQRKGIGIAAEEPYYVIEKQMESNRLIVGFTDEALINAVGVSRMNWQAFEMLDTPCTATVKLRYRSRPAACIIEPKDACHVHIALQNSHPTTAPGQYAVIYKGDTVLGGGMIEEVERT